MKYAFMTFSCPQVPLAEALALAARHGYDGLEPRTGGQHAHGIELERTAAERAAIRRQFADAGIACCCLALGHRYADPATVEAEITATLRHLDLAADIGAPLVRVFGGRLAAGLDRTAAIDLVASALARLAPEAAARGLIIALETHDDWCDPAHVAAVMQQADHPAVGVNWDVMHPVRHGLATMAESFATLQPWIRHVHIHDGMNTRDLQFRPFGEGEYDLRSAFAALLEANYSGFLSGEWINCADVIDLGTEIRRMRTFEASLASAVN
jgi:sugar phosphate isomerase/epimerase